jgi:hypothetical protein
MYINKGGGIIEKWNMNFERDHKRTCRLAHISFKLVLKLAKDSQSLVFHEKSVRLPLLIEFKIGLCCHHSITPENVFAILTIHSIIASLIYHHHSSQANKS